MKKKFFCSIVFMMLVFQSNAQSQEKVYSVLLLKLARGIQWPNESQKENFVIGILSYSPLADELKTAVGNIKKGKHTITVKELASTDETRDCDILFIPSFKSKTLPNVLDLLENKSTLVVTNKMNMIKMGSGINLMLENGKIRYEINAKSIESRGMKISTEVKNMGVIVP